MTLRVPTVGLLALLIGLTPAMGETMTAQFDRIASGTWNDLYLQDYGKTAAGLLQFKEYEDGVYTGQDMLSFCIELTETVPRNKDILFEFVDPSLAPSSDPMGADRADLLTAWFGQFSQGTQAEDWNDISAVAFQLGAWEIVHEENIEDIGDLYTGTLMIDDIQSGDDSLASAAMADDWFASLDAQGPRANLLALRSETYQDQAVVHIPEPCTITLLGIGGLALAIRFQRQRLHL